MKTGMPYRCKRGTEQEKRVGGDDTDEGHEGRRDQEACRDMDLASLVIGEPPEERLGGRRSQVVGGHEKAGREEGKPSVGDEQRKDSGDNRHIDVGHEMCEREGIDGSEGPAHRYSLRMTMISTGIFLTSRVWKEKVRRIGRSPPMISSITARPSR